MTWDPTNKQGWKRALEMSCSPAAPARVTKKVRFDTTSYTKDVDAVREDINSDKSANTIQARPVKHPAAPRERPTAELVSMPSFSHSKIQRPLPGPVPKSTQSDVNPAESSGQHTTAHTQGNGTLYDVLQSPYSHANTGFDESLTSSHALTSARRTYVDQYTHTTRSSSNEVEDFTARVTTSASSSFTRTDVLSPVTNTQSLAQGKDTPIVNASAKLNSLSGKGSTSSSPYQGFLFGIGCNDLNRGYKSDYLEKVKNNPYTTALQPCAPTSGVPVPQNATEARSLFKRGRYGRSKEDAAPRPTIEELQEVLQDLRRRFAKLKAMCDTAGIDATGDIWDRTVVIVEGARPDIKQALDKDSGKGLKEYTKQVERWDKAVGHQAILMKRLNYKQQIMTLEKTIQETKATAAKNARYSERQDNGKETRRGDTDEWKGHKTRLGRRFSGLIEKN